MNIGDRFIINHDSIHKVYKNLMRCKYQDKVFTIEKFSESKLSVYFKHDRTNIKCICHLCNSEANNQGLKSIGTYNIIIVETKLQRERNLKLKSLNI